MRSLQLVLRARAGPRHDGSRYQILDLPPAIGAHLKE
jgi:hypothetical protein